LGGLATLGLDDSDSTIFAGAALAAIGGVYLGFAIADGRTSAIAIQGVSMLAFAIVAYIGIEQDSKGAPRADRGQDLVPAVLCDCGSRRRRTLGPRPDLAEVGNTT
jgi:hypothetical protein